MTNPPDSHYDLKWKKIVNVMKSSNLGLSKIAPAGSRAKQAHGPESDQDVIFSVAKDPSKQQFHPELIKVLKANFPEDIIKPGSSNNVVKLTTSKGGKFDLVLLKSNEFDKEYQDILEYKKKNL